MSSLLTPSVDSPSPHSSPAPHPKKKQF